VVASTKPAKTQVNGKNGRVMKQSTLVQFAIADLLVGYCEKSSQGHAVESAFAAALDLLRGPGADELRHAITPVGGGMRTTYGDGGYADLIDAAATTYSSPALTTLALALRSGNSHAAMREHLQRLAGVTVDAAFTIER
jgi:hypothetical protein